MTNPWIVVAMLGVVDLALLVTVIYLGSIRSTDGIITAAEVDESFWRGYKAGHFEASRTTSLVARENSDRRSGP